MLPKGSLVYAPSSEPSRRVDEHRGAVELALESHVLLRAIFENAPVGMGMLDASFRFVRVNPKLAALNGLSAEAHIGRTPRELFPRLPLDHVEAIWARILETGTPVLGYEFCGETPASPGKTRWWREDWFPVVGHERVVGIAIVVADVTEEKRAGELQRLLVGIVGHDLRNPLAVITTSVRMLLTGCVGEREARTLRRIDRAGRRIETLARDLLDYTAISGGRGLRVAPRVGADLSRIVEAAAEEARVAYPDAVIECRGDGDVRGEWDEDRMSQLAANLLSNAAKYGARGAPVDARTYADGDSAVLEVHNLGAPIPAERLPRVFDGLCQWTDERSRQGGIGLGLFICREIVRAHGGVIEIASTAAEGTTVRVRLPRSAPRADGDAARALG